MKYRASAHILHNGRSYRPDEVVEIDGRSEIERADMTALVALGRVVRIQDDPDPVPTTKKRGTAQ